MNHVKTSLFRKVTAAALSLTMLFGVSAVAVPVLADMGTLTVEAASSVSINTQQVTLYGLNSWADEYISIPSNYATRYQLRVSGASSVTYSTNSSYLEVSSTGLITAKRVTKYTYSLGNGWAITTTTPDPTQEPIRISQQMEFGTYNVTVKADGQTFNVSVTIKDYANVYADKTMDDYLAANITSGMTTYQKVEKIAQFIAARNYSASYSSAVGLIVAGGADCWGSTDCAIQMAQKIGLQAWSRNGNRDAGAGSGHMNAMISDGTDYYEVEAGYSGTAPRYYDITKRVSLFSYRTVTGGVEVYQYDGQTTPEVLTVPSTINGKTVVGIGAKFIQMDKAVKEVVLPSTIQYINDSAFNSCYNLEKINIPASVERIGSFVFTECRALKTVSVSGSNFVFTNGTLYQGTTLLYCPNKAITAPRSGTTAIADYAFYYNSNISTFTIPATVTSIGEGAFGNCSNLEKVTFNTKKLTALPDYCFTYTKVNNVIIPDSVTSIGTRAFDVTGDDSQVLLIGKAGSVVETYASDNGHQFLDVTKMVKNTSKTSLTYAIVGDTIKVTPSSTGGKAPYTYEVTYKYQYDSGYSDNILADNATTASFPVTKVGCYVARILVTDGYGVTVEKNININVKEKVSGTATLSSSAITLGQSVTVTANGTGGYGSYQYALQYKSPTDTAWQSAVALSTNNQMTFKPTVAGTYSLRVTVKDMRDKAGYLYPTLTVNPSALKNTSTISTTTITVGSSVTVTGSATGGYGDYQYALHYKSSTDTEWKSAAALSTNTKMTFKPAAYDTYSLRVTVKDAKKNAAYQYFTLTVNPAALKNTSTISASTITVGSSVTVTGSATGGYGSYQYALHYKSSTDTEWKSAAALSTNTKMTFKPAAYDIYSLRVTVKDAKKKAAYQYFTLTVNPAALKNTSTISASTITVGSSVTVTGSATGGYGSYQYALHYKSSTDTEWKSAAALSTNTKMTFKPAAYDTYSLRVTVKDAKKKAAYKYITLTVNPPALKNTSTISASTITVGSSVTVTGSATGGYGSYQYALHYKSSTDTEWKSAVALSTNTKMTFKPKTYDTYSLRVTVKDAKKKAAYKYITLTVNPKALTNTSTISETSVTVGTTVTITGSATGGYGGYQYALEYKFGSASDWTSSVELSTNTTMTFKPTRSGTYSLRVTVKDAKNKAAYQYITLTSNPKPLTNTSKLSATEITLGQTLTVTGYASGGTPSYRYALEYKGYGDTEWQSAVPLGTATKMLFKPTKKDTYSLRITVKDAKDKTCYKFANLVVK